MCVYHKIGETSELKVQLASASKDERKIALKKVSDSRKTVNLKKLIYLQYR